MYIEVWKRTSRLHSPLDLLPGQTNLLLDVQVAVLYDLARPGNALHVLLVHLEQDWWRVAHQQTLHQLVDSELTGVDGWTTGHALIMLDLEG